MSSSKSDDEIELDFSGFKNIFKKKQPEKKAEHTEKKHDYSDHHETKEQHEEHKEETHEHQTRATEHHTKEEHTVTHEPAHHAKEEHHAKEHAEHHEHKEHHNKKNDDDEVSLDFSAIKNIFKGSPKKKSSAEEDEIGFDARGIGGFFTKRPWLIAVLLALLVVWMSVSVRLSGKDLTFTDQFADQSVRNYYHSQIAQQVAAQNPNLPTATRDQVVEQEYQKFFSANTEQVRNQVRGTSLYFKTAWSDEPPGDCLQDFDWMRCHPYMPDIDPYYWLRYARNIEEHGYPGDEMRNGVNWDNHMLAPIGRPITSPDLFHPYMLTYLHSALSIFIPGITIYQSEFFYPLIVMAATTLFVFLIARRIAGNIGGLFAGAMFAYSFAVLNRTLFGHGDTDAWVVFFPVLVTWLYLEAFETRKTWLIILFSALAGMFTGIFSIAWGGWWYIFDFILAMSGLYLIYQGITHARLLKKGLLALTREPGIKNGLLILIVFLAATGVFVTVLNSFDTFIKVPFASFGFTRLKDAVLPTLWPNVLTTVAELNEGSLESVILSMGGAWLFWVALMGIGFSMLIARKAHGAESAHRLPTNTKEHKEVENASRISTMDRQGVIFVLAVIGWYALLMLLRKQIGDLPFLAGIFVPVIFRAVMAYREKRTISAHVAILLSIWFAGTTYATFKGIRFTLLLTPAFAVAFGVFFGVLFTLIYAYLKENFNAREWIPAVIVGIIAFAFFFVWFWPPGLLYVEGGSIGRSAYGIAYNDVPIVNDAWWKVLTKIKAESQPNAQINSWWDFGHHFKAIADRPVTFDGTTQDTPQAHWTGLNLLIHDERQNVGILRMLACGGNSAFETLNPLQNNETVKTVKILYTLQVSDRAAAKKILLNKGLNDADSEKVLQYTHCDPPEMFYITSEDMVGKAGVWAHFGSWNFERAYIWNFLRNKPQDEAITYMVTNFNYSKRESEDRFYEVQNILAQPPESVQGAANQWAAPWPGYAGSGSCQTSQSGISCPVQLQQGINTVFEVNKSDYSGTILLPNGQSVMPVGIVYINASRVVNKRYSSPSAQFPYSFVLIPNGANYNFVLASPELAESMFTRTFYLRGHGLRYLKLFTHETSVAGTDIYVWKVDWSGSNVTTLPEFNTRTAVIEYIGYFENGTIFDSSITDWASKNITTQTDISHRTDTKPLSFVLGTKAVIPGLDAAVSKMSVNQTSFIDVPPELGYGTDPSAHPLAGKNISFKIFLRKVE